MSTQLILQLLASLLLGGIAFVFIDRKLGELRYKKHRPVPGEEVLGEVEQIYAIVDDILGIPFVYLRIALFSVCMMFGLMVFNNINEVYRHWNLLGSALIVVLAIKMFRWQVIALLLAGGAFDALLKSTELKPEDISENARKAAISFLKVLGYTIIGVWILSIILALVPFKDAPMAFPLLLLGSCGFLLYTALRGFKGAVWIRDTVVIGIFLGVFTLGIAAYFGLSLADVKDLWTNNKEALSALLIFTLIGVGVYFFNTDKERN